MELKIMNKEFKKTTKANEVIYTLEAASAGATSSAAVATGPVGKKGNLLVQSKDDKPVVQKRNPVAANVNATVGGGGSGAHKDRKRAEKRGEVKHKKDFRRDVDENIAERKVDFNFDANDIKRLEQIKDIDTLKAQALDLIQRPSKKPMKPEKVEWFKNVLANADSRLKIVKLMYDLLLSGEGHSVIGNKSSTNPNFYRQRFGEEDSVNEKQRLDAKCWKGYKKQGTKMKGGVRVNNCVPKESINEGYGMGGYSTVVGGAQISKAVPETGVDPGYIDQENSMTSSDLKSLYKQAVRLRDLIQRMGDDTTLEPWQQTKIAKAADYVNSVFRSLDDEYSISEAEKKGLWANIHARRKKGLPPRKPGEKGSPTKKGWDAAVAASKKKKGVGEDNLAEYETHTYTDKMGRKWRVDDEGNKDLIYDPNDRFGSKSRYSAPKQPEVYYFYAVPDGAAMKAFDLGLKKTKSGKWYAKSPIDSATKVFGNPRKWMPKAEESMMPANHFAGTPKNKLGPAAHLKGKMKRPARQGDLVGGSAEESFEKKKILKKS